MIHSKKYNMRQHWNEDFLPLPLSLSLSRWFSNIYVFIVLSPVLNDVITGIRSLECFVDIYQAKHNISSWLPSLFRTRDPLLISLSPDDMHSLS
jgi:hypothetical protein